MSLLKELPDKGATIAWSNVAAHPNLVALGTKDGGGSSGFDDYGGELELHKLGFSWESEGPAGSLLGSVKTSARFATLAWSEMGTKQADYPYGLIAGGMGDGTVNVWDPAKLVASHPQSKVASVQRHSGAVTGLQFNPHKSSSHLLASGGSDTEVFVIALDRPDTPNVYLPGPKPNTSRHTAEVNQVAWNSQVSHIMATAAQNGSCIVWDLKQKKPWCELRDSNRAPVTDVAWNPQQGQHLVTASGDDNNPVLKLWDLRSSTTVPLATLAGHTEGILSVAWCPYDASLLMSCAKDNRTFLWDLFSLKPVYELSPGASDDAPVNQMFGGYGKTAQRRYQVSWSPHIPSVVGTCSFDRNVQIFSMNGARTSSGRAPAWHRRPAGASFGFGGRLASFTKGADAGAGGMHGAGQGYPGTHGSGKVVTISSVQEDASFVAASRRFEQAMVSQNIKEFCEEKEASVGDSHERRVWQFMQIIFDKNARNHLLAHLGFDGEAVAKQAEKFVTASLAPPELSKPNGTHHEASTPGQGKGEGGLGGELEEPAENGDGDGALVESLDAVDLGSPPAPKAGTEGGSGLFDAPAPSAAAPPVVNGGAEAGAKRQGGASQSAQAEAEAEAVIKRALVVGNFEAAVQCCMSAGHMADAILLASCGGADLWAKTQAQYFERQSQQRPFLRVVHAILKSELTGLVKSVELSQWQETLAILSTYAKQEEFPALCGALAERLENEAGDQKSANLCYMCAVKVSNTVDMWSKELHAANAAVAGGTDTKALQEFVEKVSVFTKNANQAPGEEVAAIFAEYAGILASEGEMETALKYIQVDDPNGAVLLDRLYHAAPQRATRMPVPPFPFERQRIGVSPQRVVDTGAGSVQARHGSGNVSATVDPPASGGLRTQREPPLPPGWTQLTDPQRGIPYYCNTATGETQWERPPPPAQPQPQQRQKPARGMMPSPTVSGSVTPSRYTQSPLKPAARANLSPMGTAMVLGDAVQSQPAVGAGGASQHKAYHARQGSQTQPLAGAQPPYSNSGRTGPSSMKNSGSPSGRGPYPAGNDVGMTMRPGGSSMNTGLGSASGVGQSGGTAGVQDVAGGQGYGAGRPGPRAQTQVPGGVAPRSSESELPPKPTDANSQALVASINSIMGALNELSLTASDRKMLGDVTKAVDVLFRKISQGQVDDDTLSKVGQLFENLQIRNMAAANAIQQGLADSVWQTHRDWIKGLKYIITLVARKL